MTVKAFAGTLTSVTATASTTGGGNWLTATATGTSIAVSVSITNLAPGNYTGSIAISATGFTSTSVKVELEVLGATVEAQPNVLFFVAAAGGQPNPQGRIVNIFESNGGSFTWTATASTTDGASWLTFTPASGTGKSAMTVNVNPAVIAKAGTFTGSIVVTDSNNTKATVHVTLIATAPQPPQFRLETFLAEPVAQQGPSAGFQQGSPQGPQQGSQQEPQAGFQHVPPPGSLHFLAQSATAVIPPQTFYGVNLGGGGALSYTLTPDPTATWLTVTPLSGITPTKHTVTVNAAGLQPGSYTATIKGTATVTGTPPSGASLTSSLVVYLEVAGAPEVSVSPKALRFVADGGTVSPPTATVKFVTPAAAAQNVNFKATATTSKGGNWLSVSPASGAVVSGGPGLTVTVGPAAALPTAAGLYTGMIQIALTGASTASRSVQVALVVPPSGATPKLVIIPGGVAFITPVGGPAPAAQTVNVRAEGASTAVGGTSSINFTAAASTAAGGNWLSVTPTSGAATATGVPLSVSAGPASALPATAGIYTGTVTVTPASPASQPPINVHVILIIRPASTTGTGLISTMAYHTLAANVAAGNLIAVFTAPADGFTTSSDTALNVSVTVLDSQGNPAPGAEVVISSSNGEPDLTLDDLGDGTYSGSFQPLSSGAVTLDGSATFAGGNGTVQTAPDFAVSGDLEDSGNTPTVMYQNGAVSAASYAAPPVPVTPGALISIFGNSISGDNFTSPSAIPVPTQPGNTTVTVGGIPAPLFAVVPGDTYDQINLQVPFELNGQDSADIVVNNSGTLSPPVTVNLGVAPAFFTADSSGGGPGAFTDAGGSAISSTNPAHVGDTVVLYATGLGNVNAAVPTGTNSGTQTQVTSSFTLTIGGVAATPSYIGLSPGYVGLYQINVNIPQGVATGDQPVVLTVGGSPAAGQATISIQ